MEVEDLKEAHRRRQ